VEGTFNYFEEDDEEEDDEDRDKEDNEWDNALVCTIHLECIIVV
jgi:hypothetical protein